MRSHTLALFAGSLTLVLSGCGTTRVTDTQRTATEQLLVSHSVDQAVSQLSFDALAGKPVFFDPQYLEGAVDRGYLISTLRQQLLASGCLLQEERAKAMYVVEARAGAVGTDRHALLFGVPQMTVPTLVPGQPSQIPEIPFAKKTDQKGIAKIAVFAYNRMTGRPVWQSGVVEAVATAKDAWVMGAGPFQYGSIRERTEFAGGSLAFPFSGEAEEEHQKSNLSVAEPAAFQEPAQRYIVFGGNFILVPMTGPPRPPVSAASSAPPQPPMSPVSANVGGQAETAPAKVIVRGVGSGGDW